MRSLAFNQNYVPGPGSYVTKNEAFSSNFAPEQVISAGGDYEKGFYY